MSLALKTFYPSLFNPSDAAILSRRVSDVLVDYFDNDPVGTAIKDDIAAKKDILVDSLEQDSKSSFTPLIRKIDEKRDDCLLIIKNIAKAHTYNFMDDNIRTAAVAVYSLFLEHLAYSSSMGYSRKSNKVNYILKALAKGKFRNFCKILDIVKYVDALKQIQKEFDAVLKQKVSMENGDSVPAHEASAGSLTSLKRLFGYVNALIMSNGRSMKSLVNTLNEILEDVETIARNRRTRKENDEDKDTPDTQQIPAEEEDADSGA